MDCDLEDLPVNLVKILLRLRFELDQRNMGFHDCLQFCDAFGLLVLLHAGPGSFLCSAHSVFPVFLSIHCALFPELLQFGECIVKLFSREFIGRFAVTVDGLPNRLVSVILYQNISDLLRIARLFVHIALAHSICHTVAHRFLLRRVHFPVRMGSHKRLYRVRDILLLVFEPVYDRDLSADLRSLFYRINQQSPPEKCPEGCHSHK